MVAPNHYGLICHLKYSSRPYLISQGEHGNQVLVDCLHNKHIYKNSWHQMKQGKSSLISNELFHSEINPCGREFKKSRGFKMAAQSAHLVAMQINVGHVLCSNSPEFLSQIAIKLEIHPKMKWPASNSSDNCMYLYILVPVWCYDQTSSRC